MRFVAHCEISGDPTDRDRVGAELAALPETPAAQLDGRRRTLARALDRP